MGTYEPKQLISQYATGKLTPEMAVGHCLQHIDKLTETQTAASVSHYRLRGQVDGLTQGITALQTEVARLAVVIDRLRPGRTQDPEPPS